MSLLLRTKIALNLMSERIEATFRVCDSCIEITRGLSELIQQPKQSLMMLLQFGLFKRSRAFPVFDNVRWKCNNVVYHLVCKPFGSDAILIVSNAAIIEARENGEKVSRHSQVNIWNLSPHICNRERAFKDQIASLHHPKDMGRVWKKPLGAVFQKVICLAQARQVFLQTILFPAYEADPQLLTNCTVSNKRGQDRHSRAYDISRESDPVGLTVVEKQKRNGENDKHSKDKCQRYQPNWRQAGRGISIHGVCPERLKISFKGGI